MMTKHCFWICCLVFFAGCGPASVPTASVTGKVSYKGKPLTAGTVSFLNGGTVSSSLIQNGQYTVPNAAVGANKIGVVTPSAPDAKQMKMKMGDKDVSAQAPEIVAVPPKYNDPENSGLAYTVTAEKTQTYDIDLKD
jgi:hypothetical protein